LRLQANDILVLSGNSEATDLAESKLLWLQIYFDGITFSF
jgi:hypothetical protein